MNRTFLSLTVAFIGYSLLNISQAGQKIGLTLRKTRKMFGFFIWTAATFGTLGSAFINLAALSFGNVSIVGAMAGSGLASLALFSRLVMKEPISVRELIGIGTVFASAVFIGLYSTPTENPIPKEAIFFIFLVAVCVLYSVLWAVFHRRDAASAAIIAGFSGSLAGFVALFQKFSTTEHGRSQSLARGLGSLNRQPGPVAEILSNPYTLAWITAGILSMAILQFSYRRGKALKIIPWFSATYIIVPVIGGMLVFSEKLHYIQWLGLLLMVAGVLLLTVKTQEQASGSIT